MATAWELGRQRDAIALIAREGDYRPWYVTSMDRSAVIQILKESEPLLRSHGVARVAVFGSVARGDARPDSDIDIMIELDQMAGLKIGLVEYVGIVQAIQDMFPRHVDVSNVNAMRPRVRPSAERDAVYAF